MNAKRVCLEDGTKLAAWRCGSCGLIYAGQSSDFAEGCCKCQDCGANTYAPGEGRRHLCKKCWGPHYAKLDDDRLERAKEVADYDGPVCIDDRYWPSPEECLDELGDEAPEFAHTCHIHAYALDADDILQNLIENAGVEDADTDSLSGIDEFHAAVAAFNEANKQNVYWDCDSKHKVRIAGTPAERSERWRRRLYRQRLK